MENYNPILQEIDIVALRRKAALILLLSVLAIAAFVFPEAVGWIGVQFYNFGARVQQGFEGQAQ